MNRLEQTAAGLRQDAQALHQENTRLQEELDRCTLLLKHESPVFQESLPLHQNISRLLSHLSTTELALATVKQDFEFYREA